MYVNNTEMSEGMGQPGQRLMTATENTWRVGLVSGWGYNAHTLFSKSIKEVFREQ